MSQQTPTNIPDLSSASSTGGTTSQQGSTQQTADVVRSGAAAVGSEARDRVVDLRDVTQGEVRTIVDDAKDQAAQVLGSTRDQLRHQAGEQASALARTLRDIGGQLSKMADGADDEGSEVVRLVRGAADQATRSAEHLDQGGIDTLMSDLTRTARTRPGLFLLGSVAAGFTVGRLVTHLDTGELSSAAREAVQGESRDEPASHEVTGGPTGGSSAEPTPTSVPAGDASVLAAADPPSSTAGWQAGGAPSSPAGS